MVNYLGNSKKDIKWFYVSMIDGQQYWLLAGPWKSHITAKRWVQKANIKAVELDQKNWFRSFGTCSVKKTVQPKQGILNSYLGLEKGRR